MEATNPLTPITDELTTGTKDGSTAADHDEPYRYGRPRPDTRSPFPFNAREFAKLLILRGRVQDASAADDRATA